MKNNNKGFTFVELLVGIVVFAVIATAALGFLVASSRTYGSVSGALNQRMDAQLAMNQITEYIIDSNEGVCFADNTLYALSSESGAVSAALFKLDEGEIKFGAGSATISESTFSCSAEADALLLGKVTDFKVSFPAGSNADYATIEIETENRGKTLVSESTVALRNKPKIISKS